MKLFKLSAALTLAGALLAPLYASATATIAHRGVYHDISNYSNLPENSYYAVTRAKDMGFAGVELDLRLASDGTVMVTHDKIANRSTRDDGGNGWYNPIDGMNSQAPGAIWINTKNSGHWKNTLLKVYAKDGVLDREQVHDWDQAFYMQSLDSMLQMLSDHRRDVLHNNNFKIILDIQDPDVFHLAADVVKYFGVQDTVYLKFFVSNGLYKNLRYDGADTCYVYAKENNLTGLKLIPQINDGEMDQDEDDNANISAFQTRLTIGAYLDCWANASRQHGDAPTVPIVSASVPLNKPWAKDGAREAINWARSHGRQTMSIVPNPDAGRISSGLCVAYTFQSTNVKAALFRDDVRAAKQTFVDEVRPDYVISDVMGDIAHNHGSADFSFFHGNLCR
ncbi:hypothetical protein ASF61_19810 [Duganella sp. Leaf126]|uniref:glycerophosphodiester phosphodiesterase n=1 Tax=Duganella sp. Leaf126 TaxID=1736266 RepID=UPI0006F7C4FE|nr:glycerophosphodiester phosphodiesterase family protein [Duganella sp. Leaf126]KQQ45890.1 hypothetical protein ASF61_19810 [Duganella sp. Leaf126]